jgi:hypothetical protein
MQIYCKYGAVFFAIRMNISNVLLANFIYNTEPDTSSTIG